MIELNLLPKELQKKRKKRKAAQMPKVPLVPISVGVIAVLLMTHVVLIMLVRNNSRLSVTLKEKWADMKPQRDKTANIAKEINRLDKRVSAIRKITKPDLDWAQLLDGLNQAVISNIWLSEFKVATTGRRHFESVGDQPVSLDLTGYSLGKSEIAMSTVGRFMESLKDEKDFFRFFDEIELQNIRNAMMAGEEVMLFKLICRFKAKETQEKKQPENTGRRRRR
ncbi:MAG: hypothetical protein GF409_02995 [Candidatus Omnitrophica bacterium]|nr:hypothetical protein [Candidatus Omnitrophota bacterium]